MSIESNTLDPHRSLSEKSDHTKAINLKERLSSKLDAYGMKQVNTIVNNVVLGPFKTERSETEKVKQTSGIREEMKALIESQKNRTEEEMVTEVINQAKELGIAGGKCKTFIDTLTEYTKLICRLNSK